MKLLLTKHLELKETAASNPSISNLLPVLADCEADASPV